MSVFTFSIVCHRNAIFPPHNPNKHLAVAGPDSDSRKPSLMHQATFNLIHAPQFGEKEKVGGKVAAVTFEKQKGTDRKKSMRKGK